MAWRIVQQAFTKFDFAIIKKIDPLQFRCPHLTPINNKREVVFRITIWQFAQHALKISLPFPFSNIKTAFYS